MSVVNRSPFEYLLNAPAGGGVASAFQEGEAAASQQATAASMRAESALRQQKAGLDIGEFQAGAPLREAERTRMLGLYKDEGEAPTARLPGSDFGAATPARMPGAAGFIAGFEGFRTEPYYDVNAYRVGFGSDTITRPDGTVVRVAPGMRVTAEDAQRDLERRINTEFAPRAQRAVGADTWSSLPAPVQEALVSVAYNYGSLPQRLVAAAKTGNPEQIAGAIEALAGDNQGVNRQRRFAEAAHVRSALTAPAAAPQGATTPAPLMSFAPSLSSAAPQPRAPMMFSAPNAGMSFSPAGVPMTGVSEADLPPAGPNAAPAQFMVPGPGGMQPVAAPGAPAAAAPVPTTGLPAERAAAARAAEEANRLREIAARETTRQTAVYQSPEGQAAVRLMEEGRIRNDRAMYMRGQAELTRLTEAMYARMGADQPEPTFAATPAAGAAPAAVTPAAAPAPAPSPFFTATPEAIAQAPATTNLAALGITPVGRAPAGAPAAAPAPATAQPALPSAIPGLTVSGPALLGLQQVQAQRAQLQRQYDRVRLAPPGERAALRAQIEAANTELIKQERNYQVDIAVGQLSMGQWQPINNILRQMYGIQVRPVEANGQIAGYDLVQGGRTMARVTPEQLGSQVRLGLSQTFAQQEAARNQALFDANIEGLKEALKAKATATAKIAEVEANARTRGFSQVQKRDDGSVIAINPQTGDGFIYRQVPVPGGKRGETRDEIIQLRANVPVR